MAIVPLALDHPDHRVPQYLQHHGVLTVGLAEKVHVKAQPRGRGANNSITTVDYRFAGPDGKIFTALPAIRETNRSPSLRETASSWCTIETVQAPTFWQTAIIRMESGVFAAVFAAGLVIP